MDSVDGIPSYVLQNIASIKANIGNIMAHNIPAGEMGTEFANFLDSAFNDISTPFSSSGMFDSVKTVKDPYSSMPGISGNQGEAGFNIQNQMNSGKSQLPTDENAVSVKKAYESLLNGDLAEQMAPQIASLDKKALLNKLNGIGSDQNTSLITDEEFFDATALTPDQITNILKKKGSPYAFRTYEGGKSIGQLIYEECNKAGTIDKGSKTINPAMIIAIMGAESGFGKDPKAVPNNPFNVKLNGSFNNVKSFEQSLNMAVNTMYNWAVERPSNSKVSLLDYAGDKYCEDYGNNWKPNVEKYFMEFTINDSVLSQKNDQTKVLEQMMSIINGKGKNPSAGLANMGGKDISSILGSLSNTGGQQPDLSSILGGLSGEGKVDAPTNPMLSSMNMLSALKPTEDFFGGSELDL